MIYRFDDCLLDSDRRELRRGGIACQIEPQVFDLLHFLIVNRERVLSREEIFKVVWRERIVSESVLGNRINAARAAIGDNGAEQRTIRTLRRKGFRFIGAVTEEPERSSGIGYPIVIKPGKPSLALLPMIFGPAEGEFTFALKAFADDLTIALARSRSFDVVAHNRICTDETDLNQISREFGVSYLIICGTKKVGNQARLSVRLADAHSGIHVWAQSYAYRQYAELGDNDGTVAKIAAAIEPCIYLQEARRHKHKPFHALDANECVLAALSITRDRTRQNYSIAENLLKRAIALEPECVRAYSIASFILAMSVLWGWKPRHSTIPLARESARKAILLDERDPWAHFAMAWSLHQNRSPEAAIEEYRRALEINPYFPSALSCLALALGYLGQTAEALAALDASDRLEAAEIFMGQRMSARATVYFCAEKWDDAIKAALQSVQKAPGLVTSHRHLVINNVLRGDVQEARAAFKSFRRLVPNTSLRLLADTLPNICDSEVNRTLEAFRLVGAN